MVYILSLTGKPLMPTKRHGKVRRLLRDGLAKVVKRCPFTIQLLFETGEEVQPVVLGVDAGSRHIGISATTEGKVLYEADVELRNDIVELLSTRREARRARRNRKTRYRKPRFLNRVHSKNKGWLAPSIEQKISSHLTVIRKVTELLPVSEIVIETASFDTLLLEAQEEGKVLPKGTDYQQGEQFGSGKESNFTFSKCKETPLAGKSEALLIERRKAASSPSESEDSGGVSAAL